jgi:hypothetical protein
VAVNRPPALACRPRKKLQNTEGPAHEKKECRKPSRSFQLAKRCGTVFPPGARTAIAALFGKRELARTKLRGELRAPSWKRIGLRPGAGTISGRRESRLSAERAPSELVAQSLSAERLQKGGGLGRRLVGNRGIDSREPNEAASISAVTDGVDRHEPTSRSLLRPAKNVANIGCTA